MVSRKYFLFLILFALVKYNASKNSVDYSNNDNYVTTKQTTQVMTFANASTANVIVRKRTTSSVHADIVWDNVSESTTKLAKKLTNYSGADLSNTGVMKVISNAINSEDYLVTVSENATEAVAGITPSVHANTNPEKGDITNTTTSAANRSSIIADIESTVTIPRNPTTTKPKISFNRERVHFENDLPRADGTYASPITKCDIQMNNGDIKSVRKEICACAEGFESIDHDEYNNKIKPTCVEVLPETTKIIPTEEIEMTVSAEEQKETVLNSTIVDYIPTKNKNGTKNSEDSPIHIKIDVSNSNTGFTIISTNSVSPEYNFENGSVYAKPSKIEITDNINRTDIKPSMESIEDRHASSEVRLTNESDDSPETSPKPFTSSYKSLPTKRKETFRTIVAVKPLNDATPNAKNYSTIEATTKQHKQYRLAYYITGGALITAILIASVIHYLWHVRRNGYYGFVHSV